MGKVTIMTNEWMDATVRKPWAMRNVIVRLSNGRYDVAYWNGIYWCTQCGMPYKGDITHFYVFERLVPKSYEDGERV